MAISDHRQNLLANALGSVDAAVEFVAAIDKTAAVGGTDTTLGFYGTTPTTQPAAIPSKQTVLTNAGTASDYEIQVMTNSGPFGFETQAEGETVVDVVLNLQLRVNDLELKLQALGLIA